MEVRGFILLEIVLTPRSCELLWLNHFISYAYGMFYICDKLRLY